MPHKVLRGGGVGYGGKVLLSCGTKTKKLIGSRCRSVSLLGELGKNKLRTDKGGGGHTYIYI